MCLFLPQEENKTKTELKPPLGITGMKDVQQETLFRVLGNCSCHVNQLPSAVPHSVINEIGLGGEGGWPVLAKSLWEEKRAGGRVHLHPNVRGFGEHQLPVSPAIPGDSSPGRAPQPAACCGMDAVSAGYHQHPKPAHTGCPERALRDFKGKAFMARPSPVTHRKADILFSSV